jgi:hypothetical protein
MAFDPFPQRAAGDGAGKELNQPDAVSLFLFFGKCGQQTIAVGNYPVVITVQNGSWDGGHDSNQSRT